LLEGRDKVLERLDWDLELFHNRLKGDKNRMGRGGRRIYLIDRFELLEPPIEEFAGRFGAARFVAEVVGPSAISINRFKCRP
jgi:hypothetical protein